MNDKKGWIRTILENAGQLNKDQAEALMDRILKQLYYRDCRAFARVSVDLPFLDIRTAFSCVFVVSRLYRNKRRC